MLEVSIVREWTVILYRQIRLRLVNLILRGSIGTGSIIGVSRLTYA